MKKLLPLLVLTVLWCDSPALRAEGESNGGLPPLPGMASTYRTPARNETIVYVDGGSKRFHRAGCRSLGEGRYSMGRKAAVYNGYLPCRECWRD